MTLLWTTPRVWETNDPITKQKLNAISDDLTYLYNPSVKFATLRGSGANINVTSTTLIDVDNANYQLNVELSGLRNVRVSLFGLTSNTTVSAINVVDVFIDNTTYLSSLTGTPLSFGLWSATCPVASVLTPVMFEVLIPAGILAAGFHVFQPRIRVSAGTGTWYGASNVFSQFKVGED